MKRKNVIALCITVFAFVLIGTSCGSSGSSTSSKQSGDSTTDSQESETTSNKDIAGVDISFSGPMNDDVTGNFRLARVNTQKETKDYAVDYYHSYFANDDEIHWIVNFSLNTTSSITCMGDQLYIDTYDYVKDEELSAKEIGGGTLLSEYTIDLNSGDVTKVQ